MTFEEWEAAENAVAGGGKFEEPIRAFVRQLWVAGFKTKMSCGHDMVVWLETDNTDDMCKLLEFMLLSEYKDNFAVEWVCREGFSNFRVYLLKSIV